jgi:steroid delta-isomerase-like uncharacterized protein
MQAGSVVRRFFDEVINGRKMDLIDEVLTPDFIEHEETPGIAPGREGVKQFFDMMKQGFPDFRMDVEDMIEEGEKVVVRSAFTGTHTGDFMGIPATQKSVNVQVIDILRVSDGKAAEHWGIMDAASMMQQLGVAPPA